MKKLITLLMLLITINAFSQDLIIRYNNNIINNNDTVFATPRFLNADDTFYFDIENNTTNDLGIMVVRDPIQVLEGSLSQFCIGESCLTGNESSFPQTINAGENFSHTNYGDQAFHIFYNPNGNQGITIYKYELFDATNTSIKSSFYIVLDNSTIGVQNNNSTKTITAFPNPASNRVTIEHQLTSTSDKTDLVIRNITGVVVYSSPVTGSRSIISLNEFNPGIYFYSIEVNGKAIATKKLIVK